MPVAVPLPSSPPAHAKLLRAGRMLVAAVVVGALALVGYDAWLWLFAGDALERITGVHLDASLQFQVHLVPVAHPARSTRAHPHLGSDA